MKAYASNFQMAQNSNCSVYHFCLESNFSSNFEVSQSFRAKKSDPSQRFDMGRTFRAEIKEKLNRSNFEPSQSYLHMLSRVNTSFDDFLSHDPILKTLTICSKNMDELSKS